jgi:hypothetical protein
MENPLKIETRYQHFELNEDMTSQIINRVRFAFNRFGDETGPLQVHFPDTNGPEGGLDKHCSLPVKVTSLGKIMANGEVVDLRSALK